MGYLDDWTSIVTLAAAIAGTLYLLLYRLQTSKKHAHEPPIIAPAIPYVGHLLGMAFQGGRYVKGIGLRNRDKPIFTLPVPFSRIYVVTDPSLAAAVQRASKTLSFSPLIPDITKRVLGFDNETTTILRQHIDPESGEARGVIADLHDMVWSYLAPGETLSELSLRASRELARLVNDYAESHDGDPEVVSLLIFLRGFIARATAVFLYGPSNPLSVDPSLEDAFWDFDHGLGSLLMGVAPSLTAQKPFRARERLVQAFTAYLEAGHHHDTAVSEIIRRRIAVLTAHGITLKEAARSEVSFLFAGIVNSATTTFWIVTHLIARPDLLRYVRAELLARAVTELDMGGGGKPTRLMDQDALKTNCPTLMSVFREALRLGSDFYSTRLVKQDTELAGGRYFLAKGAVVQIAGGVIHADPNVWGEGVDEFDPLRFMKLEKGGVATRKGEEEEKPGTANKQDDDEKEKGTSNNKNPEKSDSSSSNISGKEEEQQQQPSSSSSSFKDTQEKKEKGIHPAAFRAFGGGKTLCPGRHFATHEILAFVAMVVLTLDIESVEGKDKTIAVPEKDDGVMPVHILEPKTDVRVKVRVRRDGGRLVVVR